MLDFDFDLDKYDTNSVKFINDYYVNEQVLSKSLLFAPLVTTGNTGSLVWNTKQDYIDNMISIWTKYWPQNRFQKHSHLS